MERGRGKHAYSFAAGEKERSILASLLSSSIFCGSYVVGTRVAGGPVLSE